VSKSFFDQQRSQRDALRETYQSALARARQDYAAVLVARTNVTNAKTQVDLARRNLAYTVISSPIDGAIADRPVDVGEYVSTTTKIATVVKTNPLRMRIDVPEQAISEVKEGESVSITTSAWPDRSFSGHVARVAPNVTASSRTLTVEAEVENSSGALKPGQFATVRILLPRSDPAVLVPARAVKTESGVSRLFVIKNGHAEQRLVQLGQTEGDLVEIKSGVATDELIATSNVDQLSDGAAVRQ
jgi:RND family efflux transporter MFP subunit